MLPWAFTHSWPEVGQAAWPEHGVLAKSQGFRNPELQKALIKTWEFPKIGGLKIDPTIL